MTYVGAAEGLKAGDFVHMAGFPGVSGYVIRVARNKTWVDVKWQGWAKRILRPELLVRETGK